MHDESQHQQVDPKATDAIGDLEPREEATVANPEAVKGGVISSIEKKKSDTDGAIIRNIGG